MSLPVLIRRAVGAWPGLLAAASVFLVAGRVAAAPPAGPALDATYLRPPAEPPGPSSRRAGVVVSEIHYNPGPRADGRDVRFVEVFNTQVFFEDLGGWRLDGDVQFTFPAGFQLPARGYVVVAANPADLAAAASLSGVMGPYAGKLGKGSGRVQLRNRLGAVQFDATYDSSGPWPVACDGGGPSLVLSRPSYGEADPRAWAASEVAGGSPGGPEPAPDGIRTVLVNEILANPVPPALDFVELYNHSESPVDLSGCVVTDDPSVDRFVIPPGTVVGPRGFVTFDSAALGFGLSSGGERLFVKSADRTRVLDAVRYGAQSRGVASARIPDGAPSWSREAAATPGAPNAGAVRSPVVLNELMYSPASGDSADEYVELFNAGAAAVDLGDWRLEDGVQFTFPPGFRIPAGGYAVVAKAAARLRTNYPNLGPGNLLGDYSGTLSNNGERVALSMPELVVSTNKAGRVVTNRIHVVVDEVAYRNGGRWGKWSDGGGSSLERRDPRADGRLAPNWADSDETRKSGWVDVAATGLSTMGIQTATSLELFLYGAGECLVDNVQVIPAGSTNLLANGDFESGAAGWVFQGNHSASSLETGEGFGSAQSLHVRSTGPGHTGPNRIRVPLARVVPTGQNVTIRAKVRWLKGAGTIHFRLHGNYFEAPGRILAASNLGTPGAPNTAATPNAGPAITDVRHVPVLPAGLQDVVVTARVQDPDGVSGLVLRWRKDPATNLTEVPMTNNGAGLYSAVIPGQFGSTLVAFHVAAGDDAPVPAASTFPSDAPVRECLVRWGEALVPGNLGSYRMWMTRTNVDRWTRREKLSNDPLDGTFVYGNFRAIYNAGGQYSGSPYHAPGWTGPAGASCDYVFVTPDDDAMLGDTEMNLLQPGNGGGDGTCQQEQQAYWVADQLGLPHCNRRPVLLYFNGVRRGITYEDAQQPNGDYVKQWFPDDSGGELRKIQLWFEFDNAGSAFDAVGADLSKYLVNGQKRQARYRWNWPLRSYGNDPNNFTNLFRLVDAVGTSATGDAYTRTLLDATDVEEWYRTHVTEHLVGNSDSYSYGGGQNMYAYKPERGPWKLLIWDIDFAFAAQGPTSDMTGIGGANAGPVNTHPPFARLYYQTMLDAVNGPLQTNRYGPIIDARFNGMRTNGATAVGNPSTIKSFMNSRRTYITGLLLAKGSPLAFTVNAGQDFTTGAGLVTLSGVAPLNVRTVLLNGNPLEVRWTTMSNWTAPVVLAPGANPLVLSGLDSLGQPVTNAPARITVTSTAVPEAPEGNVVFNEVLHHPSIPGSGFIELRNLSLLTAYDLGGWRVDGVGARFAPGTILMPGGYGLVVEDPVVFARLYGPLVRPLGSYSGTLNPAGERLTLLRPGTTPGTETVVDRFTFEAAAPWPAGALDGGSLQLVDASQDRDRAANWAAVGADGAFPGPPWQQVAVSGFTTGKSVQFYMTGPGEVYLDDIRLVAGSNPDSGSNLIANGGFDAPLAGTWVPGANVARSEVSGSVSRSGYGGLRLVSDAAGSASDAGSLSQTLATGVSSGTQYTLSFWYLPSAAGGTLVARMSDGGIGATIGLAVSPAAGYARLTPGQPNSTAAVLAPFPSVRINELQVENVSGPVDNAGEREPWVELYNSGAKAISMAGCYLTDSLDAARRWPFPAGTLIPSKGTLLVWLDGQPGQSVAGQPHAGFRPTQSGGLVALTRIADGRTNVLDYLRYVPPGPDRSLGLYPDGEPWTQRVLVTPSPRAANTLSAPLPPVFVNEWMADNTATIRNPAGNGFDDWFELYNAGGAPVDLSGYYLANSLSNRLQFAIPPGYVIPGNGRLLVWADKRVAANTAGSPDLHVPFKLSASGESIVLSTADGTIVDAVTFGQQAPDVSEGRVPDGGVVAGALPAATPGVANAVPAPQLLAITSGAAGTHVSWSTFPGLRYQLEAAPDLDFPAWVPVGDVVPAHATGVTVRELTGDAAARFYRVRLLP